MLLTRFRLESFTVGAYAGARVVSRMQQGDGAVRKVKATGGVFGAELECLATLGELIGGCVSAEEIEGWARTPDDEAAPAPNPVAAR